MANPEHIKILTKGVKAWNRWREKNPEVKPDLAQAQLSKANLRDANLRETNLSYANLQKADLETANLVQANLNKAVLKEASLDSAVLTAARLGEANLERASLSFCNLSGAYLWRANLESANLKRANLYGANLCGSNLTKANLKAVQALHADFIGATLTGACIEDWNINHQTNLDKILCDYIYLKDNSDSLAGALEITKRTICENIVCQDYFFNLNKLERRPHSRNFNPGEFTKLYKKALETLDIVFLEGIEWKTFLASFLELKAQTGSDEISIQSFENRNGAFIVRINVPPDADKADIEKFLEEKYQLALKAKDEEIFRLNTNLMEITKLLASIASKPTYNNQTHINQSGSIGVGYTEIIQTDKLGGTLHAERVADES